MSTTRTISFGVLLLPTFQLLDAAGPVDFLNSCSQSFLETHHAAELAKQAPIINWHYISSSGAPVAATSGPLAIPTVDYSNCPKLDYLLIPGVHDSTKIPPETLRFMRAKFEECKGVLTICTGSVALARADVLDGKEVCTNKAMLKILEEEGLLNKKVKWVRDKRWNLDGKVWSSAGVAAGIDLAVEFARREFGDVVPNWVARVFEYKPNPQQPDQFA
jgi:transcriptional regulator GlxA family with amidase domain